MNESTIQFSKGRHTGGFLALRTGGRLTRQVTRQRIPALGRRIVMTCSLSLEPDM
jgi:hypothetical protein